MACGIWPPQSQGKSKYHLTFYFFWHILMKQDFILNTYFDILGQSGDSPFIFSVPTWKVQLVQKQRLTNQHVMSSIFHSYKPDI